MATTTPRKPRRTKEQIAADKAAKEQRKADRLQRKLDTQTEQAALRSECSKLPPEYKQWGYVRTRAWSIVAGKCLRIANRKGVKLESARMARANMQTVPHGSVESISEIIHGEKTK